MNILQLMVDYGVDTFVIALCTVILTGLIKMPIKNMASKSANSAKITRFVTFLPLFIGFGLTALIIYLFTGTITFNREFFVKWLTAVSASLAMYAFWEKFVPSEKKILAEDEIQANKLIVEAIKNELFQNEEGNTDKGTDTCIEMPQQPVEQMQLQQDSNHKKFILTNNKNN